MVEVDFGGIVQCNGCIRLFAGPLRSDVISFLFHEVPAVNTAQKRQTERKAGLASAMNMFRAWGCDRRMFFIESVWQVLNCHQYQWTNAFTDPFNEVKAFFDLVLHL